MLCEDYLLFMSNDLLFTIIIFLLISSKINHNKLAILQVLFNNITLHWMSKLQIVNVIIGKLARNLF